MYVLPKKETFISITAGTPFNEGRHIVTVADSKQTALQSSFPSYIEREAAES